MNKLSKIFSRNKSLEKTTADNRYLLISNAFLAAGLMTAVIALAFRHENTVLVPPQLDRSVTVGWGSADNAYIQSFALYVATLAGNITPKNVQFVTENLSTLVSPRIYTSVRERLLAQATSPNFVNNAGSSHFNADRIIYEPGTGRAYVLGTVTTDGASNAGQAGQVKQMIYDIVIKMVEGKPVVDAINNYEGSEPHNEKYMQIHAEEIKAKEAKLTESSN